MIPFGEAMQASPACVNLIKEFEGCRLMPYPDPVSGGDPWTVGYGSTTSVTPGEAITLAEAEDRLKADIHHAEGCVNASVHVPMTQGEFDALVCFTFNLGCTNLRKSHLLAKLNDSDYDGASGEFRKWGKAGGKEIPGLVRRRLAEQKLFESSYI